MTTTATNGRSPSLLFVRWYRNEFRLDVLFDDAGEERLVVVRWGGASDVPSHWLDTAFREVGYQRKQDHLRAVRGVAPGDFR
jgi:hypothetical protein